jgi:hypothetical protein
MRRTGNSEPWGRTLGSKRRTATPALVGSGTRTGQRGIPGTGPEPSVLPRQPCQLNVSQGVLNHIWLSSASRP